MAIIAAEEIHSKCISDAGKVLALWLSLTHFPAEIFKSNRKGEGRRKAYYKNFLVFLREGLMSCETLQGRLPRHTDETLEWALMKDLWSNLCVALSCMLSPVPDSTNLLKISRTQEVIDIVNISTSHANRNLCKDLCRVLSQGASEALVVEKANRLRPDTKSEGEMNRRRMKYRQDALAVFKTCYAGICTTNADDPALFTITDEAFSDALATIHESDESESRDGASVDTFLMVCQAFQENAGLEALILSSFPLLCKLVQTSHDQVRNAAAAALGSADLRQVLSDARVRCEKAETRADEAEKKAADLAKAVEELQKKNELLQQEVARSLQR